MLEITLFWAAVIVGALVALSWLMGKGCFSSKEQPLENQRKQNARGEITKQEFDQKKRKIP